MSVTDSPPRPFAQRVRDTFLAPSRLFHSLRGEAPPWFDVLLVSTAAAVLVAATAPDELFLEQTRDAVTRRGEPVEITSPPEDIVRWGRMLAMLSALIMHPVMAFAIAGLLALIFSVVGRGQASYRGYLAVTTHALLVYALAGLVTLLLQWIADDPSLELSLGRLVGADPADASVLYGVLGAINPFTVWLFILLALGVAALNRTVSTGRAAAVLLGLYLALAAALALLEGTTAGAL